MRKTADGRYKSTGNNVYVYFESQNFKYTKIEAVDDFGHRFSYKFQKKQIDDYLEELQMLMLRRFEEFCKNDCGLTKSRVDNVWLLSDNLIPKDFCYESLFGSAEGTDWELYDQNWNIYQKYKWQETLDNFVGSVDWACINIVEFEYNRLPAAKKSLPFERFVVECVADCYGAVAVKAVVDTLRNLKARRKS